MRRIRIYHPGNLNSGVTVLLDQNASHHLLQVLRKKSGDRFIVFNGENGEFDAVLVSEHKKTACVEIGAFHPTQTESALKIHLGQAISRGERMDYSIQKSVELGVSEITPLFTEYCQVQLSANRIEKRVAHWQAIALSASEQSGRCSVPTVHLPISFEQWITQNHALKIICCPRSTPYKVALTKAVQISIIIGAEGGFSDRELDAAFQQQFIPMSLGPRTLRAETATVVALTALQMRYGDIVL